VNARFHEAPRTCSIGAATCDGQPTVRRGESSLPSHLSQPRQVGESVWILWAGSHRLIRSLSTGDIRVYPSRKLLWLRELSRASRGGLSGLSSGANIGAAPRVLSARSANMDKNVLTVFLSIGLTLAFTRIAALETVPVLVWGFFWYYVIRRITYYVADIRFADLAAGDVFRADSSAERVGNLFLGVVTLFLFAMSGFFVSEPLRFFTWTMITLAFNVFWLFILLRAIDPARDQNPSLTIRRMFKNFIGINVFEIIICAVASLWLVNKWGVGTRPFETIQPWVLTVTLIVLCATMVGDLLFHREFVVATSYPTNPESAA
jgi:hypothetical protein